MRVEGRGEAGLPPGLMVRRADARRSPACDARTPVVVAADGAPAATAGEKRAEAPLRSGRPGAAGLSWRPSGIQRYGFRGGGAGRSRPVRQPILAQCRIESDLLRGQRMGTRQIRATGSAPVVPPAQTVWRTVGPPPGRTRQPPHGTRFRRNWLRPGENHRVTCAVRKRSTSGAVSPRRFLPAPRPAIRSSSVVGPDGEFELSLASSRPFFPRVRRERSEGSG